MVFVFVRNTVLNWFAITTEILTITIGVTNPVFQTRLYMMFDKFGTYNQFPNFDLVANTKIDNNN